MEIITDINKIDERCDEIDIIKEAKEVRETVLNLKNTVREKGLKALSAPLIGSDKRIFVINFDGDIRSFVNPIISSAKGITLSREKCQALPGKEYIRVRNTSVEVTYFTPLGKIETRRFVGMAACVVQHEIDHLDGILLSDIALEIDEDFDKASEEERQEVIDAYLDSLDLSVKKTREMIEADPELKQAEDAIDFLTKLQNGEVTLSQDSVSITKKTEG